MRKEETGRVQDNNPPYRVRLPAFLNDAETGLGDVVKRVNYALGIRPCGGCERRATALNRWLVFTGWTK